MGILDTQPHLHIAEIRFVERDFEAKKEAGLVSFFHARFAQTVQTCSLVAPQVWYIGDHSIHYTPVRLVTTATSRCDDREPSSSLQLLSPAVLRPNHYAPPLASTSFCSISLEARRPYAPPHVEFSVLSSEACFHPCEGHGKFSKAPAFLLPPPLRAAPYSS